MVNFLFLQRAGSRVDLPFETPGPQYKKENYGNYRDPGAGGVFYEKGRRELLIALIFEPFPVKLVVFRAYLYEVDGLVELRQKFGVSLFTARRYKLGRMGGPTNLTLSKLFF